MDVQDAKSGATFQLRINRCNFQIKQHWPMSLLSYVYCLASIFWLVNATEYRTSSHNPRCSWIIYLGLHKSVIEQYNILNNTIILLYYYYKYIIYNIFNNLAGLLYYYTAQHSVAEQYNIRKSESATKRYSQIVQ